MEQGEGIIIQCDGAGRLTSHPRSTFADPIPHADSLYELVDSASREKVDRFLSTLIRDGLCFDWELNLKIGRRPITLNFAGSSLGEDAFLLVGTRAADTFIPFYEELMRINNEQANALRTALKSQTLRRQETMQRVSRREDDIYNELSSVNNELMTLQRTLARTHVELKTQRDRFRITLTSIRDAVIATDSRGRVTFMNPIAEQITRWSQAEAEGKPIQEILNCLYEDTRAPVEIPFNGDLRVEHIVNLPTGIILIGKDGTETPIEDSAAGIFDDHGGLTGFVIVFRDVTEQRMIERQRQQLLEAEKVARASAEYAVQLRQKFLAMISHELRTPLTAIKGFTSTLLMPDMTWDATSQREFLEILDDESNKLRDLIEQLLDVSRMQAGTMRINTESATFQQVIDTAHAQMNMLTQKHNLIIDVAPDQPSIQMDIQRIAQVVVNLVGNAAKYSPIATKIHLTARPTGSGLQVEVSDQGAGIPPEKRQIVFDAFQQLEDRTHHTPGVGLGLAICKGIIEAHSGRIWIADHDAPGTTVVFTLPA